MKSTTFPTGQRIEKCINEELKNKVKSKQTDEKTKKKTVLHPDKH